MASIPAMHSMRARVLTIMATRDQDQDLVSSLCTQHGIHSRSALMTSDGSGRLVAAFGWHPWFSHQIYDDFGPGSAGPPAKAAHYRAVLRPSPDDDFVASLPDPLPLSRVLDAMRARLRAHPTSLVGEVGLDRAFRLPDGWTATAQSSRHSHLTPAGHDRRSLSPYRVHIAHQTRVLQAQLRLAGELGRAASVHGVQAHGLLLDALSALWHGHGKEAASRPERRLVAKGAEHVSDSEADEGAIKPFPPRICLHSFTGPPEMVKHYLSPTLPLTIFFSFSVLVNLGTPASKNRFEQVVSLCPDDKILVESDSHVAGREMDDYLEDMYRTLCRLKAWPLPEGVERIARNYEAFIFG